MSYNGHANYNCWNVSLWLNNDEGLYRLMKECLACTWNGKHNKNCSVQMFLNMLRRQKISHTPDGVKYTFSNVRKAIQGEF